MSGKEYTTELLKLEDAQIERMEETEEEIILQISLKRKMHNCPRCKAETDQVHDYRIRAVRDLSIRGKPLKLLYRRRRYFCPSCGKRFSEACAFLGKYQRFTYQVTERIMQLLHHRWSMKDIARDTRTSVSGVARCLALYPQGKPRELPRVLSFDEFKGNANGERFQCILTAPEERRILDILPDRRGSTIQSYLRSFSNRQDVQYVVMDMNQGYRDIARAFFPQAKIVIDRFHVARYCTWAMDDVRRAVQKHLLPASRKHFKRSRRLLIARRALLSEEDRAAVDVMLHFSERLYQAYALKELFFQFMDAKSSSTAAELLSKWFDAYDRLQLPEFSPCRRMLKNWKPYILNAFDCPYSNAFTEGCNNAIKALKRVAFGFRNFSGSIIKVGVITKRKTNDSQTDKVSLTRKHTGGESLVRERVYNRTAEIGRRPD